MAWCRPSHLRPLLAIALGLFAPGMGHAAGRTSSLSWVRLEGADSCISTQALARAVEERLHRPVFVSASQGEVSVEGRIQRGAGGRGFRAVLHVRDASGQLLGRRELTTAEAACAALDESLSLVIAVMIDPDAAMAPPPEPPREPPPEPLPPAPPPPVAVAPERTEPDRSGPGLRVDLGATARGTYGLLPSVSPGVAAEATLAWSQRLGLRLAVSYLWGAKVEVQDARIEQSLLSGGLGLCPLNAHVRWLEVRACADLQLGRLSARGAGFDVDTGASALVALAGVDGRVLARLAGPLAVGVGLAVEVPLRRGRVVYSLPSGSQAQAFQMSPVAAVGELGLVVRLP